MADNRVPAVDSRKTYALLTLDGSGDMTDRPFRSWLWKECSLVSHSLTLVAPEKSTLQSSSAIIRKITALYEAGLASMAYFYFDFQDIDKRFRHNLLPSLLLQLSARSDPFCDVLSRLYKAHDDGARQPSDSTLMRCLQDMLTLPGQGPVYIILDALDECPNTSGVRKQVLDLVKDLVDLRLPGLHICVTSRPEVGIKDTLESLASYSVCLHNESGQHQDIAKYIEFAVHSNSTRAIRRWRDADKELAIKTLSERADGM